VTLPKFHWLLLWISCTCAAIAQEKVPDADYAKLIDSFANKNPVPKLIGESYEKKAVFARDYDWKENARVIKAIEAVIKNADVAWPALIEHLDDERFCLVYYVSIATPEYARLESVGSVCREIVLGNITELYDRHLPGYKSSNRVRRPDYIPTKPDELKKWCQEQQEGEHSLAALQLQAAEWGLKKVPELDEPSEEEIKESVRAIKNEIAEAKKRGMPLLQRRIWGEDLRPATRPMR
jgi:hypothetical protein